MSRSAELAQAGLDVHWNLQTAQPVVAPGSQHESEALERIAELRDLDERGRMLEHPDFGVDTRNGFYRRNAGKGEVRRRRSASERYWKRASR